MISLGIESTAHTFGIGIVGPKGKICLNLRETYKPPKGSGIIPAEAKAHHEAVASKLLAKAKNSFDFSKLNLISYSKGPGLPPCLKVGLTAARNLAKELKLPLLGVNHCVAHIEIGKLATGTKDPVVLYVSGGNTQVLALAGGRYRVFGETLDIPIGNAMDVLARRMGYGFPGGPVTARLAEKADKFIEMPYSVKGTDLSYSGLLTHASRLIGKESNENISHSFRETGFAMLTEVVERALAHTGKKEVLLTGGVAANVRLQEMMAKMTKARKAKSYVVPESVSGDNGAMIAWTGVLMAQAGVCEATHDISPRQRTDEVKVVW